MSWKRADFLLTGPDDFVRLDGLCGEFVRAFFAWLQSPEGGSLDPAAAGPLGHDADRYLRDFVVDILETGPADPDASLPRRYLANWYIVNTLTPSHEEVGRIRFALGKLYEFLSQAGVAEPAVADEVARDLSKGEFFLGRLDDFWSLTPEAIGPWRRVDDYRGRPL